MDFEVVKRKINKVGITSDQMNEFSIICQHYPHDPKKVVNIPGMNGYFSCYFWMRKLLMWNRRDYKPEVCQLYAGDAPFEALEKAVEILEKKRKLNCFLLQVPHHGSGGKYWNHILSEKMENTYYWVIPAGVKNGYGHPSTEVIEDICSLPWRCLAWVNEFNDFQLQLIVKW
jgi:hypothetical protein